MKKSDKLTRKNEILLAIHEVLGRKKPKKHSKKVSKKKSSTKK